MNMPKKGRSRKSAENRGTIDTAGPASGELVRRGDMRPLKEYLRRNSHPGSVLRIVIENVPDHVEPYEISIIIAIIWPLLDDKFR
jgi:hypothetical protein